MWHLSNKWTAADSRRKLEIVFVFLHYFFLWITYKLREKEESEALMTRLKEHQTISARMNTHSFFFIRTSTCDLLKILKTCPGSDSGKNKNIGSHIVIIFDDTECLSYIFNHLIFFFNLKHFKIEPEH